MENESHPFTSDAAAAPASTLPPSAETAAIASMIAGAAGEELGAEELAPAAALLEAASAASSSGAPAGATGEAPGGMKPFIFLEGLAPTEQMDVAMDSPTVMKNDAFTYGLIADAKVAAGAWQCINGNIL